MKGLLEMMAMVRRQHSHWMKMKRRVPLGTCLCSGVTDLDARRRSKGQHLFAALWDEVETPERLNKTSVKKRRSETPRRWLTPDATKKTGRDQRIKGQNRMSGRLFSGL